MPFIQERYEPGDLVWFHSTIGMKWVEAKVLRRIEIRSIMDTLMGYRYVVVREGGKYGDNATHSYELKRRTD